LEGRRGFLFSGGALRCSFCCVAPRLTPDSTPRHQLPYANYASQGWCGTHTHDDISIDVSRVPKHPGCRGRVKAYDDACHEMYLQSQESSRMSLGGFSIQAIKGGRERVRMRRARCLCRGWTRPCRALWGALRLPTSSCRPLPVPALVWFRRRPKGEGEHNTQVDCPGQRI
jgi:hypothetical protein